MANEESAVKKKEKISIPTKTTLNLCMKEKSVISPALFVPLLVIVLVLAAVIGYFGVYKQFERVKVAQAELSEMEQELDKINDKIADYGDVEKQYNQYNYDGFDNTIYDPLTVMGLLERQIFPVSKVRTLSVSKNEIDMTLTEIDLGATSTLHSKLMKEEIVKSVDVQTYQEGDVLVVTLRITLNDASATKGGD